jgi:excisionase family DNA binding protein
MQISYRTKELAQVLVVSRQKIWLLRKRGELKGFWVGKRWRLSDDELKKFVSNNAC